ncbi:hypothetical protein C7435_2553 [Maricaulis maris]|uniref:Uncharacterized protein n=1 Tax=Maricaulis maris TaxID=74318 RepID=A0A495D4H3_9PROT|nr:hypothetical protein C7435_2553 [Maricaulis maris]
MGTGSETASDTITPQRCAELAAEMGLPADPSRDRAVAFFVNAETETAPAAPGQDSAARATPGPVGRQAEGDKLHCLRPGEFEG